MYGWPDAVIKAQQIEKTKVSDSGGACVSEKRLPVKSVSVGVFVEISNC